jgi:hypothetical protein
MRRIGWEIKIPKLRMIGNERRGLDKRKIQTSQRRAKE